MEAKRSESFENDVFFDIAHSIVGKCCAHGNFRYFELCSICLREGLGRSKLQPTSSLGRYVFGSEISYNKAPPRLPGLAC